MVVSDICHLFLGLKSFCCLALRVMTQLLRGGRYRPGGFWIETLLAPLGWVGFKVQPEKQDRDVIAYTDGEKSQLVSLGGHNATGRVAPSFRGLPCWAGARSFILDHEGHAWRCYPARRYRTEYLGNVLDGSFRLHEGAGPCVYAYCNCTVPQERGMMPVSFGRDALAPR